MSTTSNNKVKNNNKDNKEGHGLGWIPDTPDFRDFRYSCPPPVVRTLPNEVDLTSETPKEIFDQGSTSSCVGNAVSTAVENGWIRQNAKNRFTPSRLFIYYNARKMIGLTHEDSGSVIRDAIKSVNKEGVVSEKLWQFVPHNKVTDKPGDQLYKKALDHQVLKYMRIPRSIDQMKGCLVEGYPFVFGFSVYDSFYSEDTTKKGIVRIPKQGENFLGGHAVVAVGYNDTKRVFKVRNSWGDKWGDKGYC